MTILTIISILKKTKCCFKMTANKIGRMASGKFWILFHFLFY